MKNLIIGLVAMGTLALTTGCASGGFKLTRQYARWVNKQHIILRIILYIVTLPIYSITLIIDAVLFNSLDFWEGRVSQGTYNFEGEGKMYAVTHEFVGEEKLKKSTIVIKNMAGELQQTLVFAERSDGEITTTIDNKVVDTSFLTDKPFMVARK